VLVGRPGRGSRPRDRQCGTLGRRRKPLHQARRQRAPWSRRTL